MQYAIVAAIVGLAAALPADNEWDPVKYTTTTTTKAAETWDPVKYTTTTTKAAETWDPVKYTTTTKAAESWAPAPEPAKCSYTTTYVTTEYAGKNEWEGATVYTKTSTVYPETCTWEAVKATTTAQSWSAVEASMCTSTKTYVTTDYASKNEWETAKVETKTETYTTDCASTYWSAASVEATSAASWSAASVEAASTSAWSTVSAPVAKWTGAADKQTYGMGALAIAAVAALL